MQTSTDVNTFPFPARAEECGRDILNLLFTPHLHRDILLFLPRKISVAA
jgi:hypothetical protein